MAGSHKNQWTIYYFFFGGGGQYCRLYVCVYNNNSVYATTFSTEKLIKRSITPLPGLVKTPIGSSEVH